MRPDRLARFVIASGLWLLALMLPWYALAPWLSAPAGAMAGEAMRLVFAWVEGTERSGTLLTLLTRVDVLVPQQGAMVLAQLAPEVNFRTFGYGLVLLWALLLASRPRRLALRLALGTVALLPLQAAAVCMQWLRDVVVFGGPRALQHTALPAWAPEVVAFGYQFAFLVVTPLAPVLLWLLLDRAFVARLWLEMRLAGMIEDETARPDA